MLKNAKYLYSYAKKFFLFGAYGFSKIMYKFYSCVKTGGIWDFKNKKEWKLKKGDYYVFMNIKLRSDDPGNIHFGYVGSVLFSMPTLCTGAGIYQIYSGTSQWKYIKSYFDDPRDSLCIKLGVLLWLKNYGKFIYHF